MRRTGTVSVVLGVTRMDVEMQPVETDDVSVHPDRQRLPAGDHAGAPAR